MNVEHTKQLLDGVISAGGSDELIDALRSELDAKLTPITAEALLADRWRKQHDNSMHWLRDAGPKYSFLDLDRKRCAFVYRSRIVCELSNMHDLRELVRILGGAQ